MLLPLFRLFVEVRQNLNEVKHAAVLYTDVLNKPSTVTWATRNLLITVIVNFGKIIGFKAPLNTVSLKANHLERLLHQRYSFSAKNSNSRVLKICEDRAEVVSVARNCLGFGHLSISYHRL